MIPEGMQGFGPPVQPGPRRNLLDVIRGMGMGHTLAPLLGGHVPPALGSEIGGHIPAGLGGNVGGHIPHAPAPPSLPQHHVGGPQDTGGDYGPDSNVIQAPQSDPIAEIIRKLREGGLGNLGGNVGGHVPVPQPAPGPPPPGHHVGGPQDVGGDYAPDSNVIQAPVDPIETILAAIRGRGMAPQMPQGPKVPEGFNLEAILPLLQRLGLRGG